MTQVLGRPLHRRPGGARRHHAFLLHLHLGAVGESARPSVAFSALCGSAAATSVNSDRCRRLSSRLGILPTAQPSVSMPSGMEPAPPRPLGQPVLACRLACGLRLLQGCGSPYSYGRTLFATRAQ